MRRKWTRRMGSRSWLLAGACVALGVFGIVLLRAPGHAAPPIDGPRGARLPVAAPNGPVAPPHQTSNQVQLQGPQLSGVVSLDRSAVLAHGVRRVLAEVRLSAHGQGATERAPVALAIVLDRSGSMSGEKIVQARNAVRQLVERMDPQDQVAIIAYDHEVEVVQALAPAGHVRGALYTRIGGIDARGGTVIPAALEAGAAALAAAPGRLVRRIVLVSDGLDGSGSPVAAVSESVRQRASHGIALSALGVGADYDEAFLSSVADAGRGNYEFLATATELQRFLRRELDEASRTVVDQVVASLDLPPGWQLVQAHGVVAEKSGAGVQLAFGPMFAGDERRAVVELDVSAGSPGDVSAMRPGLAYRSVADDADHRISGATLALRAVPTEQLAQASVDAEQNALAQAVVIDTQQAEAVQAWRSGDRERAQAITRRNLDGLASLEQAAPAAARALGALRQAYADDEANFAAVSAESEEGRSYGLSSNAARRARARRR